MNMILHIGRRVSLTCVFLGLGLALSSAAMAAEGAPVQVIGAVAATPGNNVPAQPQDEEADKVYATVNGKPIMLKQFNGLYARTIKDRYYHGKVPEGKDEEVRKEVLDGLALRILQVEEAERRGFKPDEKRIEQAVEQADAKYAGKPGWQEERARLIDELRGVVGRSSLVDQLGDAVRNLPEPTAEEVRAYYDQQQSLFTEPEQQSLSLILKKVDPTSPVEAWGRAYEEAQRIYREIKDGADFAEMAKKNSDDKSAANGGNMGYLHSGMMPEALQGQINKLEVGVVAEPIKGLEGFYIFRLDHRVPSKVTEFERVEPRARALFARDRLERTWKDLMDRLRSTAKIEILAPAGGSAATAAP